MLNLYCALTWRGHRCALIRKSLNLCDLTRKFSSRFRRKFDGNGYRGCALPWRGHESSRNRPTGWLCELWLACRPRMIWWHLQNPRPIWGFRGQLQYFVGNCSTSGKSVHLASCFWRFLVFFWCFFGGGVVWILKGPIVNSTIEVESSLSVLVD